MNLEIYASNSDALPIFERRHKPRVRCSYPATLRGHLLGGIRYEARAVLLNLSANGMYLRLKHTATVGETILINVRMSTSPLQSQQAPQISASGQVVRVEPKPDGTYGLAVKLLNYRFL